MEYISLVSYDIPELVVPIRGLLLTRKILNLTTPRSTRRVDVVCFSSRHFMFLLLVISITVSSRKFDDWKYLLYDFTGVNLFRRDAFCKVLIHDLEICLIFYAAIL